MIQLSNISKNFLTQEIFSNLSFKLNRGNKVGLVGRNGSGKSTLFKIILDEESIDSGEILIPKNYKIGTLRQHLTFSEVTLRDETALALSEEAQYDIYKVEKILFGLGFSHEDLEKNPLSFSGGYQIRINLAKLLLTEPNLLLLDEPTNYLDIVSLRWLKIFLQAFDGEVILITHNRDFMDDVCNLTMGIVRKELNVVAGDTYKFYAQLKANDELYEKQKLSDDKKRKELEDFIAKNKARASTAALAQSKVKQLEKMGQMQDLGFDDTLKFNFSFKETPAKVLLDVNNLSFGYSREKILFKDISFTLKKGECLAIIGKNGKGKSTLLNTIAGELTQLTGSIKSHNSSSMAHFGQTNISHLNPNSSVIDEVTLGNPKSAFSKIRSICGAMMFSGDSVDKKISLLSGGEKSRVMLGQILARDVNLLFLDEPTNHLDIDSIEALTEAIQNFKGGVIIVTHSEELLRRVANRLIVFAKDEAKYFDGGYDDFLKKIGWEEEKQIKEAKTTPKVNKKENKKQKSALITERNRKTSPLKKEIKKLENRIIEIEDLIKLQHEELIKASDNKDRYKVMEISKLVTLEESEVEDKFEQLEIVQNSLDEITNEYEIKLKELESNY